MGRNKGLRGRISWRCRYYGSGGVFGEQVIQGITLDEAAEPFRNSDLSWRRNWRNYRNRMAGAAVRLGLGIFPFDASNIRNWACAAGDVGCRAVFFALPQQENRGKRSDTLKTLRPVNLVSFRMAASPSQPLALAMHLPVSPLRKSISSQSNDGDEDA